ncbi:hypothetical protein BY996DRAFT_6535090 [Phakopsora pachyrhizi]|nr:hypothetical protein BY996DRAFT_6535090 [Phakopsora pachyrhizi]
MATDLQDQTEGRFRANSSILGCISHAINLPAKAALKKFGDYLKTKKILKILKMYMAPIRFLLQILFCSPMEDQLILKLQREITQYLAETIEAEDCDLLIYWKDLQRILPALSGMARNYYRGVQRFRELRQRSTEPNRGSTEVYSPFAEVLRSCSRGVLPRFTELYPELYKEEEGGEGASRTIIWGSFWSFQRGNLCALRWHNFTKKNRKAWEEMSTAETGRAPVHEAAGKTPRRVVCVHLEGTTPPEKRRMVSKGYQGVRKWCLATLKVFERKTRPLCEHKGGFFLFLNPERMSGFGGHEAGPAGPSRGEATIRKAVKIPEEEELMFDGKGFHQFLDLFKMAAENEGAEDYNKVKQVVFFCKGWDLKEEVMEIEGWRELDWGKLVKEMKVRWGRYRPAPRYTIQELWKAVDGWEKKKGVSSKGDYEEFSYFFDPRLKYLEKEGTFRNEDEACPLLWRAVSKELQKMAKVRLIKGKKMVVNRSGGYSLPTLKELRLAVDADMKFKGEVLVEGVESEEGQSKKEEEKKKEPLSARA